MRLSEIIRQCDPEAIVLKDCDFDNCYLIGKHRNVESEVISFINSPKYVEPASVLNIGGFICTGEVAEGLKQCNYLGGICVSPNPKSTFFKVHNYIATHKNENNDSASCIAKSAQIHPTAMIADKNVIIGEDVKIGANVVIKENTYIGKSSIVREGTIIGTPAFYYYGEENERTLVLSTGGVHIEDNVEIHCNCSIEKGVMGGNTYIGANTKIDNKALIGHDSKIGKNCTIAADATFAGGVQVGNSTFMGVSVTVSPNVIIGENVTVSAGSVVTKGVEPGIHVSGNFAIEHEKYIKFIKKISENFVTPVVSKKGG